MIRRRTGAFHLIPAATACLCLGCSTEQGEALPSGDAPAVATPGPGGRFAGPGDEYLAALATCLTDAGWKAEVESDGGLSVDSVTAEQREAFIEEKERCQTSLGTPPQERPLTDMEIGRIYDYYVDELTACVVRLGYSVSEPPSRESFVSDYYSADAELWSPYDAPANSLDVSEEEWLRLNDECPQVPKVTP